MGRKYIHGFDKLEQNRLIHQAELLEPFIYNSVDLEYTQKLLEVGCGVGAQSKILCRRFPKLKIDGVDLSKEQLATAKKYLKQEIKNGRISLDQQDAQNLKLKNNKYEAAFLCWFLEHVPQPQKVINNVYKYLAPGAKIYCTEVFNQTLFMQPYSPAYLKYWFEFNDYQWSVKGHPFVGASLGNLLNNAGFRDIKLETRSLHFDSRESQRRSQFIDFFFNILLSAQDVLLQEKRVTPELIKEMKKEVEAVKKNKDSVFYYSFIQATAKK